jgi:hypothetical protein
LFRAPVVGLLVAVGTAASLMVSDLHGLMILMMVACAALAAGAVAYAGAVKKSAMLTRNRFDITLCYQRWLSASAARYSRLTIAAKPRRTVPSTSCPSRCLA